MGPALLMRQLGMEAGPQDNREVGAHYSAVLPCAGDERWLAVSCHDEADLRTLLDALGVDDESGLPEAMRANDRDELAETLQSKGIAAGPVYPAQEVLDDPHLGDRGFFVTLDHPEAGVRRYIGTPFRWGGRAQEFDYTPAPLLGQHTDEVLREVLGLNDEELADLRASGVTADDPQQVP
jgi:benzylsuccinate CoA-transferase BbsF subunit